MAEILFRPACPGKFTAVASMAARRKLWNLVANDGMTGNSPNQPLETELDGWDVGKNTHAGPRTPTMSDIAAQHAILTVQHDPSFMKSGTVWASSLNAR